MIVAGIAAPARQPSQLAVTRPWMFAGHAIWWVAGLAGAAMSVVWNYAMTSALTWRNAG